MNWHAIHIYLHDTQMHTPFLLEQIKPLLEKYGNNQNIRSFFLRHWKKGPHIQSHIGFPTEADTDALLEELVSYLQQEIFKYAAKTPLTEEQVVKQYKQLSVFELENDYLPLEQDLTVKIQESVLRNDIWGDKGTEEVRAYYVDTNNMVLEVLGQPEGAKFKNLIYLMLAAVESLGDRSRHQLSYRSHAEAFLNRFDQKGVIRNVFEEQFQNNKSFLTQLIEEELLKSDLFHTWTNFYKGLIQKTLPLIEQRELVLPEADTYMKIIEQKGWNQGYEGTISDFHQTLNNIPEYAEIKRSTEFKSKRLVLNLLYLTFAQLGVKPTEKFMLCYSVSRWFEERLGQDWKLQLERYSKLGIVS
ncbi:lantibiotic dehydratase C-terminal domain-containing protein [Effusibacillus consociatus]|uniref:Lantibiotic dehydratase C-terminal domain-containing protein n=1 Tax=Effusibacillus consociatus TaxID=1117041 RepID=A0ABV9Q330_9BACL